MSEHEGIIFPLYKEIVDRAVTGDKDVFAKFSNRRVEPGMTLYLYETGEDGSRKIVAEAEVQESEKLKPNEVEERFEDRLFQTAEEFEEYTSGRRDKEMLVLVLDKVEKLSEPRDASGNITVAGLYV